MTAIDPTIRRARLEDIEQLIEMRHDFTFEDSAPARGDIRPGFADDCRAFLHDAITSGR